MAPVMEPIAGEGTETGAGVGAETGGETGAGAGPVTDRSEDYCLRLNENVTWPFQVRGRGAGAVTVRCEEGLKTKPAF